MAPQPRESGTCRLLGALLFALALWNVHTFASTQAPLSHALYMALCVWWLPPLHKLVPQKASRASPSHVKSHVARAPACRPVPSNLACRRRARQES